MRKRSMPKPRKRCPKRNRYSISTRKNTKMHVFAHFSSGFTVFMPKGSEEGLRRTVIDKGGVVSRALQVSALLHPTIKVAAVHTLPVLPAPRCLHLFPLLLGALQPSVLLPVRHNIRPHILKQKEISSRPVNRHPPLEVSVQVCAPNRQPRARARRPIAVRALILTQNGNFGGSGVSEVCGFDTALALQCGRVRAPTRTVVEGGRGCVWARERYGLPRRQRRK